MGLIQLQLGAGNDTPQDEVLRLYQNYFQKAKELKRLPRITITMKLWREMRVSSYTDLILMKINRTKQIEDHQGATIISEGIDANYFDMVNYAVFALIRLAVETKVRSNLKINSHETRQKPLQDHCRDRIYLIPDS